MLESHYYKDMVEAGCDEAGRGCLAGSVYAAAVILPPGYQNAELNDSKKLTDKKRKALRKQIERDAVAWAVGIVTPEEIDKINILNASFLAMHRALDQLKVRPEAVIVDGNRFKPYKDLPYTTIVHGCAGRRISAVRLERQQGLSYQEASCCHQGIWSHSISSHELQSFRNWRIEYRFQGLEATDLVL